MCSPKYEFNYNYFRQYFPRKANNLSETGLELAF